MLSHWRGSLPDACELVESKNIINFSFVFFVTRLGYECVLIFFVLSGFFWLEDYL
jgi:hypothetical protein